MIIEILEKNIIPKEQEGEVVLFKRRSYEDGNVRSLSQISEVYDYIRMLDGEGYPRAFLETNNLKFEFYNAKEFPNEIIANVRIVKK